jgi:hypothetical protein
MADWKTMPLGSWESFQHNADYTEFKSLLKAINRGSISYIIKRDKEGNVNLHLKSVRYHCSQRHLYIDDSDKDRNLTYLKYGVSGDDSVTLATYDSGILAEPNLTINLEAMRSIPIPVDVHDERTIMESSSTGCNTYFDFNFFVMCGAVGGVLLLVGALVLNPVVAIVGTCALAVGVIGMAYHRFFSDDSPEPDGSSYNLTHT